MRRVGKRGNWNSKLKRNRNEWSQGGRIKRKKPGRKTIKNHSVEKKSEANNKWPGEI